MGDVLIRNLDMQTVNEAKRQAKAHGRSLQEELRRVLAEQYAQARRRRLFLVKAKGWHRRLEDRDLPDPTDLIRRDRSRK